MTGESVSYETIYTFYFNFTFESDRNFTSLIGNVGSTSTSEGAKSMLSVISVRIAIRSRAL